MNGKVESFGSYETGWLLMLAQHAKTILDLADDLTDVHNGSSHAEGERFYQLRAYS